MEPMEYHPKHRGTAAPGEASGARCTCPDTNGRICPRHMPEHYSRRAAQHKNRSSSSKKWRNR